MKAKFTPKLYLFGREYNPAIERIFGKENIEVHKFTTLTRFEDNNADYFAEMVRYFHGWYDYLVMVTGYESKHLTMLNLAGTRYLIYEVKTEDDQDTLNDWSDDYSTFTSWINAGDEFLFNQETLLNNSEGMFDNDFHGALYNTNFDLVDMKDCFEEVYMGGFKIAFEKKFQIS